MFHHTLFRPEHLPSLALSTFFVMSLHPRSYSWKQNFSRDGFKPLPNQGDPDGSMPTHDATIDIPLEQVTSYASGYRSQLKQTDTNSSDARKRWRPRGRRQKPDSFGRQKLGDDGEEITVNTMGKIYKKILNFSTLVRSRTLNCCVAK